MTIVDEFEILSGQARLSAALRFSANGSPQKKPLSLILQIHAALQHAACMLLCMESVRLDKKIDERISQNKLCWQQTPAPVEFA